MSPSAVIALLTLLALQFPALARAAGQPVLGYAGPSASLTSADGAHRYLARPHARETAVEDVSSAGTLAHTIPGSFAIPLVAQDGSLGGLSADGRTLVLARPRAVFPERSSELGVLDADTLRVLRIVALRGDFAFDAISPNGEWVYLIQYSSPNAAQYRVRALNTRTGSLASHDIIDPHDRGEKMQGYPLSRASSPDGRWAYTVYAGINRPFVHALDTTRLQARCIDLPAFPRTVNPFAVRLRLVGHRLAVVIGPRTLTALDTRGLRPIDQSPGPSADAAGSLPAVAALAAILLAGSAAAIVRRRPRSG